ncbi:hypothetical protein WA026_009105 [Henosepilachna vigintioctopunctata]|uniref:Uncharacterized protein n=1 Tax=Henosepilachna vigintioctopunctata TaxID=420089 RepID=A0AAW1UZ82_9CUCU
MAYFEFITIVVFFTVTDASPIAETQQVVTSNSENHDHQYAFSYGVHDALTGDSKNHVETSAGGVTLGQYWLDDPDGMRRTVDYKADPVNGFNAIVRRTPKIEIPSLKIPARISGDQVPGFLMMPYPVAQLLLTRMQLAENWMSNVFPQIYLYK